MTEQKRNEIISRWQAHASIRQIARSLGMSRNTVSRVLAQIQARRAGDPDGSPSRRRPSRLDPYQPVILELLSRYPDLTAVRLLEELRQRGFTGCYSLVRQRLSELRPRSARPPVVRFETAPGAQAQMDYAVYDLDFTSEGRRRVNLFSYILGYSRRQYLRFVEAQDMTTTLREHARAFEHLGGVAATCLYDNMKVVVSGHEDGVPIYNPRFLAFATHYGFRPLACRVRRPQTKGKVERPFSYVETSLFNGRTFSSLEHLNETTVWWLAQVADVRELRFGQDPLAVACRGTSPSDSTASLRLRRHRGCLSHGQRRGPGQLRPERLLGALAVHRLRVAGATDREGTDRVQPPTRGGRPARAFAGLGAGSTEHPQGAPPPRGCTAAACAVGRAVRRVGSDGPSVLGGPLAGAALWQGPGAACARALGNLQSVRPDRRLGTGGALRCVLPRGRGTHPGGPCSAPDDAGGLGRGRAATASLAG